MNQFLILTITLVLFIGLIKMRDYEYHKGFEDGALSVTNYRYTHEKEKSYISMGFREYLIYHRIQLPSDRIEIDSIENDYLKLVK